MVKTKETHEENGKIGSEGNGYSWSSMDHRVRQDRTTVSSMPQVSPQHHAQLPKSAREPQCPLPQATSGWWLSCFCVDSSVSGLWGSVYPELWRLTHHAREGGFNIRPRGQQSCHFAECPRSPLTIRGGGGGGGLANSTHFLKRYLHLNINFYKQRLQPGETVGPLFLLLTGIDYYFPSYHSAAHAGHHVKEREIFL